MRSRAAPTTAADPDRLVLGYERDDYLPGDLDPGHQRPGVRRGGPELHDHTRAAAGVEDGDRRPDRPQRADGTGSRTTRPGTTRSSGSGCGCCNATSRCWSSSWRPLEAIYRQIRSGPGGAALRPPDQPGPLHARGRAALVHGGVRPGQPDHQLPGVALHARAGRDGPASTLAKLQATTHGRLPRRRAGKDPARAAVRRADRVRGAPALAVLRRRRHHPALAHPARRVRAVDRPRRRRARPRGPGPGGAAMDRRVRRPRRRRLRRVRAAQHDDRPGEPVLAGLPGLDPVGGRHPRLAAAGHLRPAGVRLRRQACGPPGWPARSGTTPGSRTGSRSRRPSSRRGSTATSGSPTGVTTRSALDGDKRAGRQPDVDAWVTCSGAGSSTTTRSTASSSS